ncbi:MAG: protein-glutamate O-methyltransferase CheR [Halomonas sp.]|nr:CheR family methyltransferase [Halomonas sp.]MBP5979945.1 protein-glutamate O-methyltransferase CheR [Halomonas sp.]
MNTLAPFKALVLKRCGLQLEGVAEARLSKAIEMLSSTTGLSDTASMIARLEQDEPLFDTFISHLTINETYFFREPKALNWLVDTYLPQRLAEKGAPLSILSAGCSSGEEPYSLAMALFERYGERATQLFTLSGGDVDQQVLAKARRGIYNGLAFRALHPALKQRYFSPHQNHYLISESLRRWVTFYPLNLLQPASVGVHGPFDVILFRNVSIYFDEPTRRCIQQHLYQRLCPEGILLCGVTETLGNDLGILELTETQGIFYFKPFKAPIQASTVAPCAKPEWREPVHAPPAVNDATYRPVVLEKAPPPSPEVSFISQLQRAHQLLNQNAFQEAADLLEELLAQQPWSVDTLLLAGLVARWQNAFEKAYALFKRAIYVAPDCWPAHFYKAELFRQGELTDDPIQRQHGYSTVVRLLTETPTASGSLQTIASPLPPGDAHFLAERYLNAMLATQGVG